MTGREGAMRVDQAVLGAARHVSKTSGIDAAVLVAV
ncbi:MAG: peptidoglycan-binding protein, partial [Aurantimonas sp.]|nr:peptidoglycan-binding protein [Aurantimonas sp.]